MADLSTNYMGLHLKNPLIASSSPYTGSVEQIVELEAAGVAAVILPSLFEEQIELQNLGLPRDSDMLPPELRHLPNFEEFNVGASGYVTLLHQAQKAVNIPVIPSLNGYYGGGWVRYARLLEATGAPAIELNIYYLAAKPQIDSAEIEEMHANLVKKVKSNVNIPVAVKLSPYFTAMANFAVQMEKAGADGLVLFNRFYQPDIDLDTNEVVPSLDLSESTELRMRLRWVAILSQYLQADMAITGGIHSATDIVKAMMVGAKAAMVTSALLRYGISYASTLLNDLDTWLGEHEISSIKSIQGIMNQEAVSHPAAFERANYMRVIRSMDEPKDTTD